MADEITAQRIVQDRYLERLQAELPDYTIVIDRGIAEPFGPEQLPAINLRMPNVQLGVANDGTNGLLNSATLQFDLHAANGAGETIDLANQVTAGKILRAIYLDWTLGGRLYDFIPIGISGSELDGADVGCAVLEVESYFFTTPDLFTIIGAAGQHFTD